MEGHATPRARLAGPTVGGEPNTDTILDDAADELEELDVDAEELTAEERAAFIAAGQDAIVEGVGKIQQKLSGRLRDVRNDAAVLQSATDAYAQKRFDELDEELGLADTLGEDSTLYASIEATFTRIVSGSVTLIVGIYIFAQISGTMPTPQNSELATATNTTISTTGSAFTLGAVAIIVLVAALILALVSGFGGSMRGGRR